MGLLLVTVALEFAIGIRLFWLSRKTRGAAEAAMGIAWIGEGSGQILYAAAQELQGTASRILATADALVSVSAIAVLALGVQRIFEPHRTTFGRVIQGAGVAAFLVYAGYLVVGPADYAAKLEVLLWANRLLGLGVLGWITVASHVTAASLRRQRELGLGQPFDAERFSIWAISGMIFVTYILLVIGRDLLGLPADLVRAAQPIMAFLSVSGIWVTFFPPRWLERRFGVA